MFKTTLLAIILSSTTMLSADQFVFKGNVFFNDEDVTENIALVICNTSEDNMKICMYEIQDRYGSTKKYGQVGYLDNENTLIFNF